MTIRLRAILAAGLISLFAVVPKLSAQQTTLYFTHFAAGGNDTVGVWNSLFSFVNTSSVDIGCILSTFGDDGSPRPIHLGSLGTIAVLTFTIPKGGTVELKATGGGGADDVLVTGRATLACDHSVTGGLHYTLLKAGQPVTAVGVTNSYPGDTLVAEANYFTGIALDNLDPVNSLAVSVTFLNSNGTTAASGSMTLGPGQHKSFNAFQAVPTLFQGFLGSIKFSASMPTMLGLAIGVENNATGYVVSATPAISFFNLHANYTGTFMVVSGPDVGSTGTITLANDGFFDADWVNLELSSAFKGTTTLMDCNSPDFTSRLFRPASNGQASTLGLACPSGNAAGILTRQPDGSLIGLINAFPVGNDIATVSLH